MESGPSSKAAAVTADVLNTTPLSPDMMIAVDPREVSSGALLSVEDSRKISKENRGKSFTKKPDLRLIVGENSSLERYF